TWLVLQAYLYYLLLQLKICITSNFARNHCSKKTLFYTTLAMQQTHLRYIEYCNAINIITLTIRKYQNIYYSTELFLRQFQNFHLGNRCKTCVNNYQSKKRIKYNICDKEKHLSSSGIMAAADVFRKPN
ncbi:hypothetical protein L9F63_020081, partial [Diploptera punctata]